MQGAVIAACSDCIVLSAQASAAGERGTALREGWALLFLCPPWYVMLADACQLSDLLGSRLVDLSACWLVGKSETWGVGGQAGVQDVQVGDVRA